MYKQIMVPVDLAHVDKLTRALNTAADLSQFYRAPVIFVGVTSSAPGSLGHNPAEYDLKLAQFVAQQARAHGIEAQGETLISHDPTVDVDDALIKAVRETGSDLVVMATHIPNVADHFWPSNGGRLATHTDASVFLVRG